MSEEDWVDYFTNLEGYKGDPKRSAELMLRTVAGFQVVHDGVTKNGDLEHELPPLRLIQGYENPPKHLSPMFHMGGAVYADISKLEQASKVGKDKMMREVGRDIRAVREGTMDEIFLLLALEEADHARFHSDHPNRSQSLIPWEVEQDEYDAQEHEFQALEKQLEAARELKMNNSMLRLLEKRLEAAKAYRLRK